MTARGVVVIGGGLAGITAAIALREAGVGVTLLEARPWLGGATCSFSRGGLKIDNGQHVFLRCCTSYRELLARLGMTGSATLQDRFDVTVLSPGGGRARLRRSALPAPLHLSRALASYGFLSVPERLRVARAALALRTLDPARPWLDGQRLGDWLAARGQNERARRRLWDLFIVSSLNIDGDEASVPLAATVLKTALLGDNDAADIGVPGVPLGDLHGQAAGRLLGRLGADVRLGTKAAAVERDPAGGFRVRVTSGADGADGSDDSAIGGGAIGADGVVLAVPVGPAARLAGGASAAGAARWDGLSSSPIVNVHVVYDRRVTRLPFAAAVDSPVQWVFDKTRTSGLQTGQYLAAAKDARVTDFFVTRERRATFRQAPGCGALRPGAGTSLPGLVLAGAWTDTGWPDTMEGAVRSGRTAAEELIQRLAAREPGGAGLLADTRPALGGVSAEAAAGSPS